MRVVSVIGARPQFVKAAPVCRALRAQHEEVLVHTGQHYDQGMSDVFFDELGLPTPDHHLGVGSGRHGHQTGAMLAALEDVLLGESCDLVLVYGDTNSTLAGALAAAKLGIPVAHVEAGLRSFDRTMPEEINRVLTDHASDLLLCPTPRAVDNLSAEGVTRGVHLVGDVMLDAARLFSERVVPAEAAARSGLAEGGFYLATVHRAATSDDEEALGSVVRAFGSLDRPVLWPVHPRTRRNLAAFGLDATVAAAPGIVDIEPVGYSEMMALLRASAGLLTDSGGMQKEAYFFGVPCVTLRDSTEWVETVEAGWNVLVGTDEQRIAEAVAEMSTPDERPVLYGEGHAAEAVVRVLEQYLDETKRVG